MRPKTISQTGVGQSVPYVVNHRQNSFKMSIVAQVTGTATYTIQHTVDNPADYTDVTDYNTNANWLDIDLTELVDATDNQDGNYFFPVRAVRTNLTAGSGTVDVTYIIGNVK